jgi:mannose-6-phosphate isomerase
VWPQLPSAWTGEQFQGTPRIPLLVKFLFPDDMLSVQVHPSDEYARTHEADAGGVGKTEMWYAVAAAEGAELRLGLEPGINTDKFRSEIEKGTAEQCLRRVPVRTGDAFFVPAGTVHTIGPGMVLCEVQEHSDITYRVYDFNRVGADGKPRQLHIQQALEVMRTGCGNGLDGNSTDGSETQLRADPAQVSKGALLKTYLLACHYFAMERWECSETVTAATSPERFELLIVLSGSGRIQWGLERASAAREGHDQADGIRAHSESAQYDRAQAWLLPAALGQYRLVPDSPTVLLRTYVPDLQQFARELADDQISDAVVSHLVHP